MRPIGNLLWFVSIGNCANIAKIANYKKTTQIFSVSAFTEASIGGGDTSSSTAAVRSKIRELQQQPQNQASAQG